MFTHLYKNNIYPIPVGDYFDLPVEACYLVYAPLANSFFLDSKEHVSELSRELASGAAPGNPIWQQLLCTPERLAEVTPAADVRSVVSLYLILNEKCNFSCKYCYSAQGRSKDELTMEMICPVVDIVPLINSDVFTQAAYRV